MLMLSLYTTLFSFACDVGKPIDSLEPSTEEPTTEPSTEEVSTEPSFETSTEPTSEPTSEPAQPSSEPQRPSNTPFGTGIHSVSSQNTTVTLPSDDITLHTFYPTSTGPFPIVIFHHGFQLSAENYLSYGEHLASWGFVVVMPSFFKNSLWSPYTHAELGTMSSEIVDYLSTDILISQKGDVDTIAVAGHSLGGKIAMYHASFDDRIDAVFAIDPVDSAPPLSSEGADYPSVTPQLMGNIALPIGIVGEVTNASCMGFCQPCAPEAENFAQYYNHASSPAIQIEIIGANHMSFLDDPECGFTCDVCSDGTDDPEMSRKLTQKYMVSFLYHTLRGNGQLDEFLFGLWMEEDMEDGLVTMVHQGFSF